MLGLINESTVFQKALDSSPDEDDSSRRQLLQRVSRQAPTVSGKEDHD